MGRTLHFKIVKDNRKPYNEKEFNGIVAVTNKYNTGQFEGVWTCENFHANPLDYYPNWNAGSNWDKILVRQDQLVAEGVSLFNVIKAMHKEKLICFHDEEHIETGIACGFVKVQGNEFNSLLVLTALVEISVLMPHA
ncbi:MAG: hypothetical protein NTV22_01140, partial [bacterium]|nr:hypothetical protein [bacterium]